MRGISATFATLLMGQLTLIAVRAQDPEVCLSATNTYTVKVDLFAGELGYYYFEECGDLVNPTIGMVKGETYTFVQQDVSNFYHPIGFAYFPDGAHEDVDELEPGIAAPGMADNECVSNLSCPAPIYHRNGVNLGTYSNLGDSITVGEDDFGLDAYEPLFFHPLADWVGYGTFEVLIKYDLDYDGDIFYFCHIHSGMTGRIKLLDALGESQTENLPALPMDYYSAPPSGFDQECGTFGLNSFQLPNPQCLSDFVCDVPEDNVPLKAFSACIDAMDCSMMAGMTTGVSSGSSIALFNHQMIPHHQNAVNMAKALLKTGQVTCDNLAEGESPGCIMETILREIINNQNFQIQTMAAVNEEMGYPETDDCEVIVSNEPPVDVCVSPTKTFTMKVDLFAGELGYYTFEECGNTTNPTIGMEVGEVYTFVQEDRSNHYHPVGFSYFPDGAHDNVDELEPGVAPGDSTCAESLTCPAPMYFADGVYLGTYSNIAMVTPVTEKEDDFGLDLYEPLFFHPLADWAGYGKFDVKLKFDEDYDQDIFYFCHIHQYMTGRIKLLKNNVKLNDEDLPPIEYTYDEPSEFDKSCGAFGLDGYQLPNKECLTKFVCDVPEEGVNNRLRDFSQCIDAMDCSMMAGMTTKVTSGSAIALFNHQMIPHHQNAVNMAKALLNTGTVACDDLAEGESPYCEMERIAREIINNQNFQIQTMKGVNKDMGYPETDDCEVIVSPSENDDSTPSPNVDPLPTPAPTPLPTPSPGVNPLPTPAPTPLPTPSDSLLSNPMTPSPSGVHVSAVSSISWTMTGTLIILVVASITT